MTLTIPADLKKAAISVGKEVGLAIVASLEKHIPAVDLGKANSTIQVLAPVFLLKLKEWLEGHHTPATPEAATEEVAPG